MSVKKNFYSDNVSGAAPEILAALVAANAGDTAPYGADPITEGLPATLSGRSSRPTSRSIRWGPGPRPTGSARRSSPRPTGPSTCPTPATSTAASAAGPSSGRAATRARSRCRAWTARSSPAELARMVDEAVARPADRGAAAGGQHHPGRPRRARCTRWPRCAPSSRSARARRLWVHMDGARLANAVARLGCTPAEATWKAGVDVLSFGATKNGALTAEAVVFFNRELAQSMRYRRRRGGHLFSKMRFLSVQLDAFVDNGLWLRNARHANAMAQRVREGLARDSRRALPEPDRDQPRPRRAAPADLGRAGRRGLQLLPPRRPQEGVIRIACAFDTTEEAVDALVETAQRYAAPTGSAPPTVMRRARPGRMGRTREDSLDPERRRRHLRVDHRGLLHLAQVAADQTDTATYPRRSGAGALRSRRRGRRSSIEQSRTDRSQRSGPPSAGGIPCTARRRARATSSSTTAGRASSWSAPRSDPVQR